MSDAPFIFVPGLRCVLTCDGYVTPHDVYCMPGKDRELYAKVGRGFVRLGSGGSTSVGKYRWQSLSHAGDYDTGSGALGQPCLTVDSYEALLHAQPKEANQ